VLGEGGYTEQAVWAVGDSEEGQPALALLLLLMLMLMLRARQGRRQGRQRGGLARLARVEYYARWRGVAEVCCKSRNWGSSV